MISRRLIRFGTSVVMVFCIATNAGAQDRPAWEVEVHVGGVTGVTPGGSPLAQFPVGAPLGAGRGGGPPNNTRAVSSWYFGDGAQLLNSVSTANGTGGQLDPLDAALRSYVVPF